MMLKSSTFLKVFMAIGFFVSLFAFFWLASVPARSYQIFGRLGYTAAVFCALGSLTFTCAALASFLVRERHWSPRTSMRAGLPLIILALIAWAADPDLWRAAMLLATSSTMAGFLCRRLAYPDVTDDQATAPDPPPSLFHN
jgi:hypothetical protein